ncbi:MAG: hypothetical protein ABJ013_05105 [Halioglobus sp.]
MKVSSTSRTLLPFLALFSIACFGQTTLPTFEGPYLGQKTPSSIPMPFGAGVISTDGYEYGGVFTPDMSEFYYIKAEKGTRRQNFVVYREKENKWTGEVMSKRLGQPTISPDGNTMHLGGRYLERTEQGWSERKTLDLPFTDIPIMRLTSSSSGTYFFDTWDESNKEFPIRYSRLVDGKYQEPQNLSKEINTGTQLNHPYIAPDESYLIWDAIREDGFGDSDLYISYRQEDGSWGKAINLGGEINTKAWDAAGYVTPDEKYFFFNRMINSGVNDELPDVDIFWVKADFIEKLRPQQ